MLSTQKINISLFEKYRPLGMTIFVLRHVKYNYFYIEKLQTYEMCVFCVIERMKQP